jgi:hypothetical protein
VTASPEIQTVAYERAHGILCRRVPDSLLLLVRDTGELLKVSGAAVAVWECLDGPQTLTATAHRLAEAFGMDTETVQRDIEPVLEDLVDHGALMRQGSTP